MDIFGDIVKQGEASKSMIQILALLQRLRQTCDHVALCFHRRMLVRAGGGSDGEADDDVGGDNDDDDASGRVAVKGIDSTFLQRLAAKFFSTRQQTPAAAR